MKHEVTLYHDGRWIDAECTCGQKGITESFPGGADRYVQQHADDVARVKELAQYVATENKWESAEPEEGTIVMTTGQSVCPTVVAAFTMGGGFSANYGPAVGFRAGLGGSVFYSGRLTSKPKGIASRVRAYVRQQAARTERDRRWRDERAPLRELAVTASSAVSGTPHNYDAESFVALDGRLTVHAKEDGLASIEGTLRMDEVVAMLIAYRERLEGQR